MIWKRGEFPRVVISALLGEKPKNADCTWAMESSVLAQPLCGIHTPKAHRAGPTKTQADTRDKLRQLSPKFHLSTPPSAGHHRGAHGACYIPKTHPQPPGDLAQAPYRQSHRGDSSAQCEAPSTASPPCHYRSRCRVVYTELPARLRC